MKMEYNQYENTTTNSTGLNSTYNNYCSYRLPCGLCKETMKQCPEHSGITYRTTITCNSDIPTTLN